MNLQHKPSEMNRMTAVKVIERQVKDIVNAAREEVKMATCGGDHCGDKTLERFWKEVSKNILLQVSDNVDFI